MIAFVAEYDALPEIGHGCGHNIIATGALGAALVLQPLMDGIGGRIRVIGTPAEDSTGDKVVMIERGVFDDVDFAMQCHPNDRTKTGPRPGGVWGAPGAHSELPDPAQQNKKSARPAKAGR